MRTYERTQYRTTYGDDLQTRLIMRRMWKEKCRRIRPQDKIEEAKIKAAEEAARLAIKDAQNEINRNSRSTRLAIGKEVMMLKETYPKGEYVILKRKLAAQYNRTLSTINKNLYLYMKSEGMKDAS